MNVDPHARKTIHVQLDHAGLAFSTGHVALADVSCETAAGEFVAVVDLPELAVCSIEVA